MRTDRVCLICGNAYSPIAYARAKEVKVYIPEYHQLSREQMMAAYHSYQVGAFHSLMDYDRVVAWAKTTPRKVVGWAGRIKYHPLRRYLNDADPVGEKWYRWDIYLSACDALKRFAHLPHTWGCSVYECYRVHPDGVIYTIYIPLPTWTQGLMARLAALPFDSQITRELFLTMLRAKV
jgi:hypothetical protein